MKKYLILTLLLFFISSLTVLAYKPIPSYNVPVQKNENFIEKRLTMDGDPAPKGKRDMLIQSSVTSSGRPLTMTVYVYSVDGRDMIGPLYLVAGQTLTVPIDDREWGCYVMGASDHVYISVWIVVSEIQVQNTNTETNQPFQNNLIPQNVMESFYNG